MFNKQENLVIDCEYFVFRHTFFQDFIQYFYYLPNREVEASRVARGNFRGYISRIVADEIEIELDQCNVATKTEGISANGWSFTIPISPSRLVYQKLHKLADDYIIVTPPYTKFSIFQSPFANRFIIHISQDMMHYYCQTLHLPEPHSFLHPSDQTSPVFHCSSEKINSLRQLCFELFQMAFNLESCPKRMPRPNVSLIKQQLKEGIAENLLLSLAESREIKPKKALMKRSSVLKNAEQFMIGNLKTDVTTKDICDNSKVSQRNLEYIFKDFYGIPPKKFFNLLRLNALNKELRQRLKKTNIVNIAQDYGFFHRGRLATDYKKLFGELPSETLGK